VFRVPSRPTISGAVAPPRLAYGSRRRLVGVMHGRNGWLPNGRAFPTSETSYAVDGPAFRAPWGELEHEIPYVTITTQLFPLAWWTAPSLRATATAWATADPIDILYRPVKPVFDPAPASVETPDPGQRQDVMAAEPVTVAPVAAELAIGVAPPPRPAADRRRARRATHRTAQARRGLVARLVVVAVGLIISLIAVESATRRRP